jgi:hypothetical protein
MQNWTAGCCDEMSAVRSAVEHCFFLLISHMLCTPSVVSDDWMKAVVLGLTLYWAFASLLVCYWSAGRVGRCGLLGQKGCFGRAVKQWWPLWWREELGLVDGSLCAEDLKMAISAAQHGERQRERESYRKEKWMPDKVTRGRVCAVLHVGAPHTIWPLHTKQIPKWDLSMYVK